MRASRPLADRVFSGDIGLMTFPTKQTTASTQQFTSTTSPIYNLPSGITSGDLLLLFVNTRGASTVTLSLSGWTPLFTPTQASTTNTAYGFYRFADGTEGSTIGGTFSSSVGSSSIGYRFSGASAVFAGTPATANSANPNPPSLAPGVGSLDFYWLALGFVGERNVTANPANYANLLDSGRVNNQPGVFGVDRQLNASSEDPGAYTLSAGLNWVAQTVAIRPAGNQTTDKNLAVSSTTAASATKGVSRALALVSTTATLRTLRAGKVLVIALTTATALTKVNIRAVIATISAASSAVKTLATSKTFALTSPGAVVATKRASRTFGLTSATVTSVMKQIGKPFTIAVSTTITVSLSRLKLITIAVSGAVSVTKGVARTIIVTCITQVIRAVTSGLFPLIRKARPRLQKSREDGPTLNRFR